VLEAMACGTPVVYAKAGSLHEIAGNAGVQVFPCDVVTLAGTLLALLKSRDKQLLLRRTGREQAAKFTWTATIQSTAAVYGQLIHANSDAALNGCDS
jgi:glycosyltransferase involved in cell wall biosynthesis